jgi:hypothetical protein
VEVDRSERRRIEEASKTRLGESEWWATVEGDNKRLASEVTMDGKSEADGEVVRKIK